MAHKTIIYNGFNSGLSDSMRKVLIMKILLDKVRCNDCLGNYFPVMYRYGINKNILYLTFSRAEF